MTPAGYFKDVAAPNVAELARAVGNMRLAINAILSLDALAGILHADLHSKGQVNRDDAAFRDHLAAQHFDYGLVRDAAFALKHGELRGKARLVQRAKQVTSYVGVFDEAVFDRSLFDTEAVIWIEANDPTHSRRADHLTRAVLNIFQGML